MRGESDPMLVVAIAARALAQSARRGGIAVVALDCFADRDTSAAARICRTVTSPHGLRFDRDRLLREATQLAPDAPLVYGSGFEGRIPLLRRLGRGRTILGNPPMVVASVRDPFTLLPLLASLGIRTPETRATLPAEPGDWLAKHPGSAGGTRVQFATPRRWPAATYFQRRIDGRCCSVLFLADGRRATIVGFNEQWTSPARPGFPFLYGGAVSQAELPAEVASDIGSRLDALVAATGLVGLNGIDCIVRDDRWWLLEVNPRPTATAELYDPEFEHGLFRAHVAASAGTLPETMPRRGPARASTLVHASEAWTVPADFHFPPWCRDLPREGIVVRPGDPVCSVHAEGETPEDAVRGVRERERAAATFLRDAAMAPVRV